MYPLRPETGDSYKKFKPIITKVFLIVSMSQIVINGKGYCSITVNFFKSYFPFIMTFFPIHCNHWEKGGPAGKPELLRIFNGLLQMLVTIDQKISGDS